jgi:hypothetical protein
MIRLGHFYKNYKICSLKLLSNLQLVLQKFFLYVLTIKVYFKKLIQPYFWIPKH